MRTYINAGLADYVSKRFPGGYPPRMAVIPFSVPETFAPTGSESVHFGRDLALLFQRELLRSKEIGIVELFNRESWPGKRAEFHSGNYRAIEMARNAGYDLVLVGYLDDITNETDLGLFTKIIDAHNAATVWFGKTVAYSKSRVWRRMLSRAFLMRDRPDLFAFPERSERLAVCTLERALEGEPMYASTQPETVTPVEPGTRVRPPVVRRLPR